MKQQTCPLRIGDTVMVPEGTRRIRYGPEADMVDDVALDWDGTVVDIIDPDDALVRVYWRYPLGKVSDHRADELLVVV